MKKLEIDVSLTLKIIQNEHRLKELFKSTSKRNIYNTTDYKYYNTDKEFDTENLSLSKIDNMHTVNKFSSDIDDTINASSKKTMRIEKENTDTLIKAKKDKYKISNVRFMTKENKGNKTSKLNLYLNPFVNKTKNNPINLSKDKSKGKTPLNRYMTSIKNFSVDKMIKRFQEKEEKIQKWLENERTKKELKENRLCQNSPKINKKSKKINLKIRDGFLLRLQKSEYEKQQKAEIFKEFMKKKKLEEEMKHLGLKGKSRTKLSNLNADEKMTVTINEFYALDEKRKEKIDLCSFVPKINKRSTSMAELRRKKYSTKNLFERLAKNSKFSIYKKNILDK